MVTISELRTLASRMSRPEFEKNIGPFTLAQQPPKSVLSLVAQRMGPGETLTAPRSKASRSIDLVLSFDKLVIATLPPVRNVDELVVGRLPDCDLVIENPSVSKRHAVLKWDSAANHVTVLDLGSSNGTRLDERRIGGESPVADGDVVSFGDVDYWFLLAGTLYQKLHAAK